MSYNIFIILGIVLFILFIIMIIGKINYKRRLREAVIEGKPPRKMNFELILYTSVVLAVISTISSFVIFAVIERQKVVEYERRAATQDITFFYEEGQTEYIKKETYNDIIDLVKRNIPENRYIIEKYEKSGLTVVIGYQELIEKLSYNIFYYVEYDSEDNSNKGHVMLEHQKCYTEDCNNFYTSISELKDTKIEVINMKRLPDFYKGFIGIKIVESKEEFDNTNYTTIIEYDIPKK